jgi:hypothetical protein
MTTPTREQRTYRAHVTRQGSLEIRRLHRSCPECQHITLYCAERYFCGAQGEMVCVESQCIRCGWLGSSDGGSAP